MAALSANANSVQILSESADHLTVRLFLYQQSAGNQSSQLVINAETLAYRTQILNYDNHLGRFVPGDIIVDDSATSNATGDYIYNVTANSLVVTHISGNTTGFAANDVLVALLPTQGSGENFDYANTQTFRVHEGSPSEAGTPLVTVLSVVNPRRVLTIDSIQWSVTGANAAVGLEFANSSVYDTAIMLSGTDYYGRNELDAPIGPKQSDSNGNLYISTYNVPAGGGYSITLTLRKVQGFASASGY
jgi:hypothetical protein